MLFFHRNPALCCARIKCWSRTKSQIWISISYFGSPNQQQIQFTSGNWRPTKSFRSQIQEVLVVGKSSFCQALYQMHFYRKKSITIIDPDRQESTDWDEGFTCWYRFWCFRCATETPDHSKCSEFTSGYNFVTYSLVWSFFICQRIALHLGAKAGQKYCELDLEKKLWNQCRTPPKRK